MVSAVAAVDIHILKENISVHHVGMGRNTRMRKYGWQTKLRAVDGQKPRNRRTQMAIHNKQNDAKSTFFFTFFNLRKDFSFLFLYFCSYSSKLVISAHILLDALPFFLKLPYAIFLQSFSKF